MNQSKFFVFDEKRTNHPIRSARNPTPESEREAKRIIIQPNESSRRGIDLINTLNDDCLARIFMHLPVQDRLTIQQVCKRWRANPALSWAHMESLHLRKQYDDLPLWNSKFLEKIFKESDYVLRRLIVEGLLGCTILPPVGQYCHNLTMLEIELPPEDVFYADWFPQLRQLLYLKIRGNAHHFSQNFFETLPRESLTELHLLVHPLRMGCYAPLPDVAVTVLEKLTKLSALTLNNFVLRPNMVVSVNRRINLTFLDLEGCHIIGGLPHLGLLINLDHLNLANVYQINNNVVTQISETCKNLKYLNLTGCYRLTDNGMKHLYKLPQLEELGVSYLGRITDEPFSRLHNLKVLECIGSKNVGDMGIITLVSHAPNLQNLKIWKTGVTDRACLEIRRILERRMGNVT